MGVRTRGGQDGQPLLLKISDAPPFQRQSPSDQAQQGSGEAGGPHAQTSPRKVKILPPHPWSLTSFKTQVQPGHTLPVTKTWIAHMGHPSCPKTHYVKCGMCFTYLYFPALSDVCPTFLLFRCAQMHVLTPLSSLPQWFAELDEAARPLARRYLSRAPVSFLSSGPKSLSAAFTPAVSPQQRVWLSETSACAESSEPQHKLGRIISWWISFTASQQNPHITTGSRELLLPDADDEGILQQREDQESPTPEPRALQVTQPCKTDRRLNWLWKRWKYSFYRIIFHFET